jgi:hypothetical protein
MNTKNQAIISFAPDGTALCRYTNLGGWKSTAPPISNSTTPISGVMVKDRKRKVRFFSRSRIACQQWEHQNLEPR